MDFTWVSHPVWFVVVALAAYRLTRLWVEDSLPPLPRVRAAIDRWAQDRWDAKVYADERPRDSHLRHLYGQDAPLSALVSCYWCSGFWFALGCVLVATLVPLQVWALPFLALALSAVTGLLSRITD